jgi:hypothetical protein
VLRPLFRFQRSHLKERFQQLTTGRLHRINMNLVTTELRAFCVQSPVQGTPAISDYCRRCLQQGIWRHETFLAWTAHFTQKKISNRSCLYIVFLPFLVQSGRAFALRCGYTQQCLLQQCLFPLRGCGLRACIALRPAQCHPNFRSQESITLAIFRALLCWKLSLEFAACVDRVCLFRKHAKMCRVVL